MSSPALRTRKQASHANGNGHTNGHSTPAGVIAAPLWEGEALPICVRPLPDGDRSAAFLAKWVETNRTWVDSNLREYGAVLFRGWDLPDPVKFEQVALAYDPHLGTEYRGTSPRKPIEGTTRVFSASEFPSYIPIPQHLEMSFLPRTMPKRIYFFAHQVSEGFGGETAIADFRQVYKDMNPVVRDKFEQKGVINIRNYPKDKKFSLDPWKTKSWPDIYGHTDKRKIEQDNKKQGLEAEWLVGDNLRLVNKQNPIAEHPETKEKVWSSHAHIFHMSMAPCEYKRIAQRSGQLRYWLLHVVAMIWVFFLRLFISDYDLGQHARFGDDSKISDWEIEEVRKAVWKNMKFPKWQQGDIMCLDNKSISHGRQPYVGNRKICVAWNG